MTIVFRSLINLTFFTGMFFGCSAQNSPGKIRDLGIGEKIPFIPVSKILNSPRSFKSLNDFRGKLIILDFFATTCSSCIENLPRLDSLQNKFESKIQIIVITYERRSKIATFLKSNKLVQHTRLPYIVEDTLMSKYFEHLRLSHEVWIDKDGIVEAITFPEYVRADNIQQIIDGNKVNWLVKRDRAVFDRNTPLIEFPDNKPIYYSIFSRFIPGLPGGGEGWKLDTSKNTMGYFAVNLDILNLYWRTFDMGRLEGTIAASRLTILNISDSSRFFYNANVSEYEVWRRSNEYCFEINLPVRTGPSALKDKIRESLDSYLNLNSRIEKRRVRCLILLRDSGQDDILKSKTPQTENRLSAFNREKYIHNDELSILIRSLNRELSTTMPVIDETNYTGNVDIEFQNIDISDLNAVREILHRYGLELKELDRDVDFLVISDNIERND